MSWSTVAAACAVVVDDGKLLMTRQRRATGIFWELPGGYVDPGETFEEAAAREALEETGVAVEIDDLVCTLVWQRQRDQRRNVVLYFAAHAIGPAVEPRPQLEEGIEAAAFLDVRRLDPTEIHPLERPIVERLPEAGYQLNADVVANDDGSQAYRFR